MKRRTFKILLWIAGQLYLEHEWAPGATSDACWGPEGLCYTSRGFYFRQGAFEFSAWPR